jgi:hypothetical protein
MKTIEIDGKQWEWKTIRQMRRDQIQAARKQRQPTLFDLRDDARPPSQKKADGRYQEPTLFNKL